MLKCVLFLLSGYYYGIVEERAGEICTKLNPHKVKVVLKRDLGEFIDTDEVNLEDTLIIADSPQRIQDLLEKGKYVVILYHEKNRGQHFPMARYGVEDVFMLEYRSYEEAYKRLAGLPWNIFETDRLKVRESTDFATTRARLKMWMSFTGYIRTLPSPCTWKTCIRTERRSGPICGPI